MPVISALWEAKAGRSPEVTSLRPAWPTWWSPIFTENIKISWAWWQAPVIPATWETEVGELLEPGRQQLQWAEIMSLHSSLGDKCETLSQINKQIRTIDSCRFRAGNNLSGHIDQCFYFIKDEKAFFDCPLFQILIIISSFQVICVPQVMDFFQNHIFFPQIVFF